MSRIPRRLVAISVLLAIFAAPRSAPAEARRPSPPPRAEQDFIDRHWRRPIAPQGEPPERFSPVERSLLPVSCGACHPVQFADWRASGHSKSMGPGIAGQLAEMSRSDPPSARSCLGCHAPLAEQADYIPGPTGLMPNPAFDATLRQQGLVCAGCHVRGHQRFGPPPREGSPVRPAPR